MTDQIIELGINSRKLAHAQTLAARADRLQKEEKDLAMADFRQKERRAARKVARETRAKEQAKTKMRDEIRRVLIDKGTVVNPATSFDLLDIHGCYEKGNKQFLGALGGQLQQLYYVVNAIFTCFNDDSELQEYYRKMNEDPKSDSLKNPTNLRELMLENFFMPFLLTSIKELKGEELKFLISPQLEAVIAGFKLTKNSSGDYDFTKLTQEQYIAFRHAFVEQRMLNSTYMANKGERAMEMILSVLCMILCNKVPKGIVSFRTDSIINKIRLVHAPRGVEPFTRTEIPKGSSEPVTIEKNTNERAVVRILVPKRTMTLSEINAEKEQHKDEDGEENKGAVSPEPVKEGDKDKPDSKLEVHNDEKRSAQTNSRLSRVPSERIIMQDQEDKALAIGNRINLTTPYMVLVMNQFAARAQRLDYVEQMKSKLFDWFHENPKMQKKLLEIAEEEAEFTDRAFIEANCDEYNLPCLEYNVHTPDHE